MIHFECRCGTKIKVADEYAGKKGKCPKCKEVIEIPKLDNTDFVDDFINDICKEPLHMPKASNRIAKDISQKKTADIPTEKDTMFPEVQPITIQKETKDCPYCGEEILEVAKKCKHCGEYIEILNIPITETSIPVQQAKNNSCYQNYVGKKLIAFISIITIIALLSFIYFNNLFKLETGNADEQSTVPERSESIFPAKKIREGIENWSGHKGYFIKHIAIQKGDNIEYPYDIEITVSSMHRVLIDSIPDQATYTFHIDGEFNLDDNYTVLGGDREDESDVLFECLKDVLRTAK